MNKSRKKSSKYAPLGMDNNNNGHNREVADSSEEESRYNFGAHCKDLSNSLKTIGHQLQLSSEILKNAPSSSELQFSMHTGETKKSTIIVRILITFITTFITCIITIIVTIIVTIFANKNF